MIHSSVRWNVRDLILYEDDALVVVNKPAGLAVQSASSAQMDLESLLKTYYHSGFIGVVHRLDQPVEGLLVFARTAPAAAALGRQLQNGRCRKYYYAAVSRRTLNEMEHAEAGERQTDSLEAGKEYLLENELLRDGKKNLSMVVPPGTPGAKHASLSFRAVAVQPDRAVLRVCLHTGRHHQIRVQLSHAGWPLAGDRKYGGDAGNEDFQGLGLCAAGLSFEHPGNRKPLDFRILPANSCFGWAEADILHYEETVR